MGVFDYMGEAKRRGDYTKRRDEAIGAGRVNMSVQSG